MKTGDVCNREVVFIERAASIAEVARLMRAHHVGDLVVVEEKNGRRAPVGIVTDRDLVLEVLAEGVNQNDIAVGDVMSYELVTANEDDDLFDTLKHMRTKGIRRLPVVDRAGSLVGIVTVDDLLDLLAEQVSDLARIVQREQTRERERRR
ncbi:MAG: CBS domain-containing protein [Gammaproteobacteria bacterium]|nr:MAG: CBS domain-containing protein [Gammaproteobacteria bacterium]